ncbi:SDR family NAD(P)-dependent oxidoreductase [Bacteroidetes/Chlorobi group bacterium ChocPot_Mid]|nr:MAG: SDR family NAD(P)-dependent oxidoreductase [Bacteroidetes/Chlorobi group bacterium ChocPot_Mid]
MNPKLIKKGQTALITGAGSGLGFAFAKILSEIGLNLILVSKNSAKLNHVQKELENYHNGIIIFPCDFSDENDVKKLVEYIQAQNIEIDFLINNAGVGIYKEFTSINEIEINKMISINLLAPTLLTRYILEKMSNNNSGIILNISSTMALRPSPKWSVYAAEKSYLSLLSRSLYYENKNKNILISVLYAGKINTDFDRNAGFQSHKTGKNPDAIVRYTLKKLNKYHSIIIPGAKAKIIYFCFKMLPDFITKRFLRYLT